MTHELAEVALRQARDWGERVEAVRTALRVGMPLWQVERFLDWLDMESEGLASPQSSHLPDVARERDCA